MAVNKVVFNTVDGEQTLIDLTADSVTSDALVVGFTAHDKSGEKITGTIPHEDRTFVGYPAQSGNYVNATYYPSYEKRVIGDGKKLVIQSSLSQYGDVAPEEVMAGKTFTSTAGLKKVGTYTPPEVSEPVMQEKSVTPTEATQSVTPDSGYDGLSKVNVGAIPAEYIVPSGTMNIERNGTYNVRRYTMVEIDVDMATLQEKYVTPSATPQTVTADDGYDGLSAVTVYGDPELVPSNILKGKNIFGVEGVLEVGGSSLGGLEDDIITRSVSGAYKNERITYIGSYAFAFCDAMTSADFWSVDGFESNVFEGCTELKAVILRSPTLVPMFSGSVTTTFGNDNPITDGVGLVFVPAALLEEYKADALWSTISSQLRAIEDFTVDGTLSGEMDWELIDSEIVFVVEYPVVEYSPTTEEFSQINSICAAPGTIWGEFIFSDSNSTGEWSVTDDDNYYVILSNTYCVVALDIEGDGSPELLTAYSPIGLDVGVVYVMHRNYFQI